MKIMITGALGHIGSALIERIMTQEKIVIVDNLSTQRYCSLFRLSRSVDFIEKDFQKLTEHDMEGVELVVHLAGITDAAGSMNKEELFDKEADDAIAFAKFAEHMGVEKFIYPSTTSVYGKGKEVMYEKSSYSNIDPQSPYAAHKVKVEKELLKMNKGMQTVILRLGTIFGISPGMRFHTAINSFCYSAAFKKPLTVWSENEDMYRPYLDIEDACEVISAVANTCMRRSIYNVVTVNEKLSHILQMIRLSSVNDIEINRVSTPLLNQHSYYVDSTLLEEELKYKFTGTLEKGIRRIMDELTPCPF